LSGVRDRRGFRQPSPSASSLPTSIHRSPHMPPSFEVVFFSLSYNFAANNAAKHCSQQPPSDPQTTRLPSLFIPWLIVIPHSPLTRSRSAVREYRAHPRACHTTCKIVASIRYALCRTAHCRRKTQRVDLENVCLGRPLEPSFSHSSWPAPLQHDPVSPARRLTCGPVA
jgi:hypothetical protein